MTNRQKNYSFLKDIRLLFTGFSMGIADLVPGVSGGTIAFLYGIYDELLFSIKQATGTCLKLFLQGNIRAALRALPVRFLTPVLSGILIAIFGFAYLVSYLLDNHPILTWSLFFGFIVGSVIVIKKRVPRWSTEKIAWLLAGAVLTFGIIGFSQLSLPPTPMVIFLTGAVAFCAMILPGISGIAHYGHIGAIQTRHRSG